MVQLAKTKEPPFLGEPLSEDGKSWNLPWYEWLRDIPTRINERVSSALDGTENNFPKFDSNSELVDSGKAVPDGDVVGTTDTQTLSNKDSDYYTINETPTADTHATNKQYVDDEISDSSVADREYTDEEVAANSVADRKYVAERYITENLLPEAGTEPGTHYGSYRIGFLNEDDFLFIDKHGRLSFNGRARIAPTKIIADSVTINGFTSGNTVADLRSFHDGKIFEMTETAGGDNWLIVDFVDVEAFNWLRALLSYDGSSSHALHNQLYRWGSTSWETYECNQDEFTDSGTIYCNKDYFVPDSSIYIGTGADAGRVRVRYKHTTATVNNHKVYINGVALYQ